MRLSYLLYISLGVPESPNVGLSPTPNDGLSPPNDSKKMGQIWREIRFRQDFDGTLSTFHPLSPPNQSFSPSEPPAPIDLEKLHLWPVFSTVCFWCILLTAILFSSPLFGWIQWSHIYGWIMFADANECQLNGINDLFPMPFLFAYWPSTLSRRAYRLMQDRKPPIYTFYSHCLVPKHTNLLTIVFPLRRWICNRKKTFSKTA